MIIIVNYGLGNLGSILNMIKKIGAPVAISSNITDIEKANKLILPGVGSFDAGIKNISNLNLLPVLEDKVLVRKTPILGICLGMQLFTNESEEGVLPGFGWVNGKTVRFQFQQCEQLLRTPHMGWNTIELIKEDVLFTGTSEVPRFYFVHSYHVECAEKNIITKTHYGYDFVSSLRNDNIWGVQFHPEKSHKFGLALLKNFCELT